MQESRGILWHAAPELAGYRKPLEGLITKMSWISAQAPRPQAPRTQQPHRPRPFSRPTMIVQLAACATISPASADTTVQWTNDDQWPALRDSSSCDSFCPLGFVTKPFSLSIKEASEDSRQPHNRTRYALSAVTASIYLSPDLWVLGPRFPQGFVNSKL